MSGKPHIFRKNHFIKKGFQINFSIRFLVLIAVEAVLLWGLFWYMSHNTLTTGYVDSQLRIENTSSFFLPSMMASNLVIVAVVAVIGLIGLIFISHKIAGPLEISSGDLTHRIRTREKDQLKDLADSLNLFTLSFDDKMAGVKQSLQDLTRNVSVLQNRLSSEGTNDDPESQQIIGEIIDSLKSIESSLKGVKTSQDSESKSRED